MSREGLPPEALAALAAASTETAVEVLAADNRRSACWLCVALTLFAAVAVGLPLLLLSANNGSARLLTVAPPLVFFGIAIGAYLRQAGRTEYTPIGILHRPLVGRTKWFAFDRVRRLKMLRKRLLVDDGRVRWLVLERFDRRCGSDTECRDRVHAWLGHYFDLEEPIHGIKAVLRRPGPLLFILSWVVLSPWVLRQGQLVLMPLVRQGLPPDKQWMLPVLTYGVETLLPVLAFFAVCTAVRLGVRRMTGHDLLGGPPWHRPREAGHGFEVRPAAAVTAMVLPHERDADLV